MSWDNEVYQTRFENIILIFLNLSTRFINYYIKYKIALLNIFYIDLGAMDFSPNKNYSYSYMYIYTFIKSIKTKIYYRDKYLVSFSVNQKITNV